jgi:hypothetical protein
MTNTYALTDYDVYDDADYDNFGGRGRRRRKARRRSRKLKRRKRSSNPIMGRPPVFVRPSIRRGIPRKIKIRPRIIRGRPMKLPPIEVKGLPIIPIRKPKPRVSAIKIKRAPIVKSKTPISHLIRKTRPAVIKKPLSKPSKVEVEQIEAAQIEASKKAMESDGKTSKIVKVVAIVGLVGVTGFGIYKFIQNKKLSNGHISTSK